MTPRDLQQLMPSMAAHARATYPAECCGLVLADAAGTPRFVPIANIAGTPAASGNSNRSGRDGYVMEPRALLGALEEAERSGGRLAVIVHSHPDVGAYFSKEDREMALAGEGEPLWPGVQYLVISCRRAGVDAARLFTWNPRESDFAVEEVPVVP
jgi:[CysO sulfur-carrier protein]-S-L-cysteine hydrolase